MNSFELIQAGRAVERKHSVVSVYTTDDKGNLVPVKGVEVVTMRDAEGDTPILVVKR